jgi:hypothetical protein
MLAVVYRVEVPEGAPIEQARQMLETQVMHSRPAAKLLSVEVREVVASATAE